MHHEDKFDDQSNDQVITASTGQNTHSQTSKACFSVYDILVINIMQHAYA